MNHTPPRTAPPRIESVKIGNFRALRDFELKNLTPMTALIGPNGAGKSTVFDALAFLAECFEAGLRHAWNRRGRARESKTRSSTRTAWNTGGPVTFEIEYRETQNTPLLTYHLEVDEVAGAPAVVLEWLQWRPDGRDSPFRFLEYRNGRGHAAGGEVPRPETPPVETSLSSPDLLAANTLGLFREHPRVAALRDFITDWHISRLSPDSARREPETGTPERLTPTGGNLANVVQYLSERHPDRLERISETLARCVPHTHRALTVTTPDARLLLQIKDAAFDRPVPARFVSDGTLKMLALLVLLYDSSPPPLVTLEQPENFLHPRLLHLLAEKCLDACERTQLLVATHSPLFLDALRPAQARILRRAADGCTRTKPLSEIPGVSRSVEQGATLGNLWMEGRLRTEDGDPPPNGTTA